MGINGYAHKPQDNVGVGMSGYLHSPWPAEDGGPMRLQALPPQCRLALDEDIEPRCTARKTSMTTMTVLGAPGEVYLLTHSAIRSRFGLPTAARVERIDPETLKPLARSPKLPGGPMWPGGMAIHANGDIIVVYGRWIHRLDRECRIKAARQLPEPLAYNSFAVLDNGLIVTKQISDHVPARLSVLDPVSLQPVTEAVQCPEPSIARLSAVGGTVYVVGTASIMRFHWDGKTLVRDADWRHAYLSDSANSYGWDTVIDGENAWFMDNGRHRYTINMIGRGVNPGANRLIRVSLANSADTEAHEICGRPGGSITNPPLVDPSRKIVIGYDSANRHMTAWRYGEGAMEMLWQRTPIGCASHMLLDTDRGLIVTNDYDRRSEAVIILDIETGDMRARAVVGGITQGVVFPSPGWNNDIYWCSMGRVARIYWPQANRPHASRAPIASAAS